MNSGNIPNPSQYYVELPSEEEEKRFGKEVVVSNATQYECILIQELERVDLKRSVNAEWGESVAKRCRVFKRKC